MRVLLVHAHPMPNSFCAAMRDAVLRGLAQNNHEVRVLDLYAIEFEPRFSAHERAIYLDEANNQEPVADQIELIRWAEGMVFVFPTWWYGLPAILKGWLDRCFPPGLAFRLDERGAAIRPGLTHIRMLAGVTSCGSTWRYAKWVGEPHRRILMRGIGALCAPRCAKIWLAHFNMDTASRASLAGYLDKIEQRFSRLH